MHAEVLPGPTGERNEWCWAARGTFACISPWNFPLAIFIGQLSAALVTGNAAIAKPAPQTPLMAAAAVRLVLEAGVPPAVVSLLPGDDALGAALVADRRIAGVVFTGSNATARRIAQTLLADESRALIPLLAETGGLNAMLVDSTALSGNPHLFFERVHGGRYLELGSSRPYRYSIEQQQSGWDVFYGSGSRTAHPGAPGRWRSLHTSRYELSRYSARCGPHPCG